VIHTFMGSLPSARKQRGIISARPSGESDSRFHLFTKAPNSNEVLI